MTIREEVRTEFYVRLEAIMQLHFPAYKTLYANQKFEWPQDVFVLASLDEFSSQQATLGTTDFKRFNGAFMVEIFIPETEGTRKGYEIVDVLETAFGSQNFRTTACGSITVRPGVTKNDRLIDGWFRMTVVFGYHVFAT